MTMLALPFALIPTFRNRRISPLEKYLRVLVVIAIEAIVFAMILGLLIFAPLPDSGEFVS
ncbi:hypothetical protein [Gordonia sp. CPCC 205333]|uniref:hypothetical protein n=1 Tax=Gordonia sp. CPCC 205333 TaxID=3140790 RepID=UPI003AF3C474